ncbi:Aste57867_16836 [Aphanomyces stellatus]|nr:hypothetical protein As57867_016778 [Aphanomyces stellatus]VFT93600.1 Aste57867_16836 [Aphanomyces stellatus]
MRMAASDDLALLKEWAVAFFAFIGAPVADAPGFIERALPAQALFIWENAAGEPVGFAGHAPPVQLDDNIVYRIGPVFVPESERRKGYASALTAALSAYVMAKDVKATARVCLYADAANPASNKAYQNVGFMLHSETSAFDFEAVGGTSNSNP